MLVTKPEINFGEVVAGVYKITFDNTCFYFGSSVNLRNRFFAWEHKFRTGITKNSRISELLKTASEIKIEIVEVCSGKQEALFKETVCISENETNPKLLNFVSRPKTTIYKGGNILKRIPVAQFTKNGDFVCMYQSITAAEKVHGRKRLGEFFNGKIISIHGFIFKKLHDAKDQSAPSPRERVKVIRPKGLRKKGVPVFQYDLQMNFIKKHNNPVDAAIYNLTNRTSIHRVLSGERSQHKNYIFRYIEK